MTHRRLLRVLVPPLLMLGALLVGAANLDPRPGEALWLRWVWTAASHPLRTGLALLLLWGAFSWGREPTIGAGSADRTGHRS